MTGKYLFLSAFCLSAMTVANWGKNWFIEVKGGASAFLGSPIGCGDVFDRLTPALQVGLGKWFTPAVGGRVAYQGMSFKNGEFKKMNILPVCVPVMQVAAILLPFPTVWNAATVLLTVCTS